MRRHLDNRHSAELAGLGVTVAAARKRLLAARGQYVPYAFLSAQFSNFIALRSELLASLQAIGLTVVSGFNWHPLTVSDVDTSVAGPSSGMTGQPKGVDQAVAAGHQPEDGSQDEEVAAAPVGSVSPRDSTSPAPAEPPSADTTLSDAGGAASRTTLARGHSFLDHFTVAKTSDGAVRRILGRLTDLANLDEPELWIVEDTALLERFLRERLHTAANTLRKDLFALLQLVRSNKRPGATKAEAEAYLKEQLAAIGPIPASGNRVRSDAVTLFLRKHQQNVSTWMGELAAVAADLPEGFNPSQRGVASSYLKVAQFLFFDVSRLVGYGRTRK